MTAHERGLRRISLSAVIILGLAPLVAGAVPLSTPALATDPTSSFYFESDMGDLIGHGRTGYGTDADSSFAPREDGIVVTIPDGARSQTFSLRIAAPGSGNLLPKTTYRGDVFPFNYHQRGNSCLSADAIVSAFTIHDVAYLADGTISMLSMSVEQACSSSGSFYAELRYNAEDPTYGGVMVAPNSYNTWDFDWTLLPTAVIGSSSTRVFTVTGVGSRAVNLGSSVVGGADASDFGITDDGCSRRALDVSSSCQFTVRFEPSARGERKAVIRFGLDTASGKRELGLRAQGQIPTTTTMSLPKGPFLYSQKAKLNAQVTPRPDDGCSLEILFSGPSEQRAPIGCDAEGKASTMVNPGLGLWQIRARSIETTDFALSTSDPRTVRWVEETGDWGTGSIRPATFYPYQDGYLDTLTMRGSRGYPIAVDITITRVANGEVVATASVPMGSGAYRWDWDGMSGDALAPAGDYDVAIDLRDEHWNELTVAKRVRLSHQWVKWTRKSVTLRGKLYSLQGASKDGWVSRARSSYANGVRLSSGKGVAAVEYAFPVATSDVYGKVTVGVRGRSTNRHQALSSIWNPKLGGFRDLGNFDAAVLIGPGYRWWKTSADGSARVRQGKVRSAVIVWKGLGRTGPAVFDIESVKLTYMAGTLMAPAVAASTVTNPDTPNGWRVSRFGPYSRLPIMRDAPEPPATGDEPAASEESQTDASAAEQGLTREPLSSAEPAPTDVPVPTEESVPTAEPVPAEEPAPTEEPASGLQPDASAEPAPEE